MITTIGLGLLGGTLRGTLGAMMVGLRGLQALIVLVTALGIAGAVLQALTD